MSSAKVGRHIVKELPITLFMATYHFPDPQMQTTIYFEINDQSLVCVKNVQSLLRVSAIDQS